MKCENCKKDMITAAVVYICPDCRIKTTTEPILAPEEAEKTKQSQENIKKEE